MEKVFPICGVIPKPWKPINQSKNPGSREHVSIYKMKRKISKSGNPRRQIDAESSKNLKNHSVHEGERMINGSYHSAPPLRRCEFRPWQQCRGVKEASVMGRFSDYKPQQSDLTAMIPLRGPTVQILLGILLIEQVILCKWPCHYLNINIRPSQGVQWDEILRRCSWNFHTGFTFFQLLGRRPNFAP